MFRMWRHRMNGALALLLMMAMWSIPASGSAQSRLLRFNFGKPVQIPFEGYARVYAPSDGLFVAGPPVLEISGVPGTITSLTLRLTGLSSHRPEDLTIVLETPHGRSEVLMAGEGGTTPLAFADLSFDLDASQGAIPDGPWRLFILDEQLRPEEGEGEVIPGSLQGWSLDMTTTESDSVAPPPNDLFANRLQLSGKAGSLQVPSTGVSPTGEAGEPPVTDADEQPRSLWFTWTAPATGRLSLRTGESSYLPHLAFYAGSSLEGLEAISGFGDYPVEAGTAYQIRADAGREPFFGNLQLDWQLKGSQLGPMHHAHLSSSGDGYQVLICVLGTDFLRVTPYEEGDSAVPFNASSLWTGLYLYDYTVARFTYAMYDKGGPLAPVPQENRQAAEGEEATGSERKSGRVEATEPFPRSEEQRPRFSLVQAVDVEVFAPAGGYQDVIHNFGTGETIVSPFQDRTGEVCFPLPLDEWIGVFHYDYIGERFTELDLRLKL